MSSAPFSPAARDDEAAETTLETDEAALPPEAEAPELEAGREVEEDMLDIWADETRAEAEEPEGRAVLPVADERRTETDPDAEVDPQRADWS